MGLVFFVLFSYGGAVALGQERAPEESRFVNPIVNVDVGTSGVLAVLEDISWTEENGQRTTQTKEKGVIKVVFEIVSLPTDGKGSVRVVQELSDGSTSELDFVVTWYSFELSFFIYADWEGWQDYVEWYNSQTSKQGELSFEDKGDYVLFSLEWKETDSFEEGGTVVTLDKESKVMRAFDKKTQRLVYSLFEGKTSMTKSDGSTTTKTVHYSKYESKAPGFSFEGGGILEDVGFSSGSLVLTLGLLAIAISVQKRKRDLVRNTH